MYNLKKHIPIVTILVAALAVIGTQSARAADTKQEHKAASSAATTAAPGQAEAPQYPTDLDTDLKQFFSARGIKKSLGITALSKLVADITQARATAAKEVADQPALVDALVEAINSITSVSDASTKGVAVFKPTQAEQQRVKAACDALKKNEDKIRAAFWNEGGLIDQEQIQILRKLEDLRGKTGSSNATRRKTLLEADAIVKHFAERCDGFAARRSWTEWRDMMPQEFMDRLGLEDDMIEGWTESLAAPLPFCIGPAPKPSAKEYEYLPAAKRLERSQRIARQGAGFDQLDEIKQGLARLMQMTAASSEADKRRDAARQREEDKKAQQRELAQAKLAKQRERELNREQAAENARKAREQRGREKHEENIKKQQELAAAKRADKEREAEDQRKREEKQRKDAEENARQKLLDEAKARQARSEQLAAEETERRAAARKREAEEQRKLAEAMDELSIDDEPAPRPITSTLNPNAAPFSPKADLPSAAPGQQPVLSHNAQLVFSLRENWNG